MSASSHSNDDGSSPFFLNIGDDPTTVLVTPLLDGTNYRTWKRSMEIALGAMGKLEFVRETLAQPSAMDPSFQQWNVGNAITQAWIINSCQKEIARCIMYSETAAAMWKTLKEMYEQRNASRVFELLKGIYSLNQGSLSVTSYICQLDALWNEYDYLCPVAECDCGCSENRSRDKVMKFLMGLNESYAPVRSRILLMDPLPSLNRAFSYVIQEETCRLVFCGQGNGEDTVAMNVSRENDANNQSTYVSANYASRPVCSYCGKKNHIKDNCYKLHGFPPGFKF